MSGSASVGFSLSPYKTLLKEFTPASDIDIGIISGYYFDIAWHELREFKINSSKISMSMKTAIEEHRLRYIYWGTIATDRILPLLSFGQDWDNAMRGLKKYEGFGSRDIKFRIYKDNKSFRDYITQGIIKCRDNLMEGKYEKLS
jgi:hypothetical protein